MSRINDDFGGWGRSIAGALFTIFSAAACGNSFAASDCKATRTCVDPSAGGEGGEPSGGGTGGGGGGNVGGEGGVASVVPECTAAVDCSNGDALDGVEECVDGACRPGNAPPRVVSMTPADREEDVEPNAAITIEFSEPLAADTVTLANVRVLDGDTLVPGALSYEGGVVTFVAEAPLRLRAKYEVRIAESVTDEDGVGLASTFSSEFSLRDGSWHITDLPGKLTWLAPSSPLARDGTLLLAWSGDGVDSCPASAAWLELGATQLAPRKFAHSGSDCDSPLAAASPTGAGIVSWKEDGLGFLAQHRAEEWDAEPLQVSTSSETYVSLLGVSPLGVVTRFVGADVGGLTAVRTSATGAWESSADPIAAPYSIYPTRAERVGFDSAGNGIVAFLARDSTTTRQQMMVSRYTVASGKWAGAEPIPGSAGEPNEAFGDRSVPVVEVAPSGEAMVVWSEAPYPGRLMGSHFDPEGGWSEAEVVSGTVKVESTAIARPSLTFDGERFVTAWLGLPDDGVKRVFTSRYDVAEGWASPEGHDAKRTLPAHEQPQVVSDGHGSLLLLWRTGAPSTFPWVQRRFVGGAWTPIELLPGDPIKGLAQDKTTLLMNDSGVASITWPVEDEQNHFVAIRAARFY